MLYWYTLKKQTWGLLNPLTCQIISTYYTHTQQTWYTFKYICKVLSTNDNKYDTYLTQLLQPVYLFGFLVSASEELSGEDTSTLSEWMEHMLSHS